ncbi:hypothetical protein HMJ29_09330 [Hymenobacter taeanensis]|uniref:PH domain-containing protein n=1 Tax=Hymenobacter taeanensis TaxID=2735321 RepID=A0A6M6BJ77_9BACT|nr:MULTISPECIES: hypothetical protein [Hymenobacter]QJX47125.1 hypothetical protein HMJ29_09330 [Hymenobacter taeanensis]UOQ81040.1 hypothetical protein MUN83_19885 [Hymenobacter sp. 5414T-23]
MKLLPFLRPLLEAAAAIALMAVGLRFITSFFASKSRVYRPTFLRQFALAFWPLLCLGVGLPFLGSFFYIGTVPLYEQVLLGFITAVVLGFSVPALVLHAQYYARNLDTTLVFDPKQNILEVYEGRVRIPFGKSDLIRVERVTCQSRRMFWSNYNYIKLHLRTGEVLTLTSLLTRLDPVAEFLRNTPLEHQQRWFCFV